MNDAFVLMLRGIRKAFSGKLAVDGLDLSVAAGEVYVFLGPNGAGKTTTMKIAVGLIAPDAGAVSVLGRPVKEHIRRGRRVPFSYVPEEPHLYERLTAREFFRFIGETSGIPEKELEERVARFGTRLGVFDFIDEAAVTYSHGMRQRVAVTASLITCPALFVIDEPMVGLDPSAALELRKIIREIASSGAAVLLSTHTIAIAQEIADRIGIMCRGRITAEGGPDELTKLGENLEQAFLRLTANPSPKQH